MPLDMGVESARPVFNSGERHCAGRQCQRALAASHRQVRFPTVVHASTYWSPMPELRQR